MLKSRRRYHIAPDSPRKRQKAESHVRILKAARALFVKRGYDGTTARDIAERAGLSVGALFLHFKSKADILKTIIWANNEAQHDLMRRLVPTRAGVKARLLRMAEIGYEQEAAQLPLSRSCSPTSGSGTPRPSVSTAPLSTRSRMRAD
jgi:AcrR family transcriptional regulator